MKTQTYILLPANPALRPHHAAPSMSDEARQDWIADQQRHIADSPLRAVQDFAPSLGIASPTILPLTEAVVLDLTQDQLDALSSEDTGLRILADKPLHLIRPAVTRAATLPSPDQLWHLETVGLGDPDRRLNPSENGQGIGVAVLDTGIDAAHPELAARLAGSHALSGSSWMPNSLGDTQGHGSHVAGLIAGQTVGVAPGASLFDFLLLPYGKGSLSAFVQHLERAIQTPSIKIVNLSCGMDGLQPELNDILRAAREAGVLCVAAIGNEGPNFTSAPANHRETLSVGAADPSRKVSAFSGSASLTVDGHNYEVPNLLAPGAHIHSAAPGGGFVVQSGSSMATPLVAGIAARLLQQDPSMALADLKEALLERCRPLAVRQTHGHNRQGAGLIHIDLSP